MPRLFTGIEVPIEIALALSTLRGGLPGARWIDPENYHLTLRFMGDIDDDAAGEVADNLARIRLKSFPIVIDGLGAFGARRPHSLFARVTLTEELAALQQHHERAIQRAGLPPDPRRFIPHVTIARLRGVSNQGVATYLELRAGFSAGPFSAERFVLFSSKEGTGGGPYLVELGYPLDAAASE